MSKNISIQLYSLRELSDLDVILDTVKNTGYEYVELVGGHLDDADNVKLALDRRGLKVSSSHVSMQALRDRFDVIMQACKSLGFTKLYMPASPPDERQNPEPYWTFLGRELAQMAWRAQMHGIELGYHNHHWELKIQESGKTALECLFSGAGNSPLKWQMDVAWMVRGGADPIDWMIRYKNRLNTVHAKDLAIEGTKLDEDGWDDVGHGALDWGGSLKQACLANGVQWFVSEHDKPSDPVRFANKSFAFLKNF